MFVSTGEELVVLDEDSMVTVNDFVADFVFVFWCDWGCCFEVNVVLDFRVLDFERECPAATGCPVAPAGCTTATSGETSGVMMVVI